jgi:hypothetical protein
MSQGINEYHKIIQCTSNLYKDLDHPECKSIIKSFIDDLTNASEFYKNIEDYLIGNFTWDFTSSMTLCFTAVMTDTSIDMLKEGKIPNCMDLDSLKNYVNNISKIMSYNQEYDEDDEEEEDINDEDDEEE